VPAAPVGKPAGNGGIDHLSDFPTERMMRDAKITPICEDANEMQNLILAKDVDVRPERRA
jgi:alkylation response protein AidB-like acyl-CoA dehydrogenase